MHRLLARQIRKHLGGADSVPPPLQGLVHAIDEAYQQMDADRALLERSMELSSREVLEQHTVLAEAEEKYRSIFENATEGIAQTTPAGGFIAANPALARMCGYQHPADLMASVTDIGSDWYVDAERRAQIERLVAQYGLVSQCESQVRRRDGTIIWISETTRAAMGPDGHLHHYESTLRDITERKAAEQESAALQSRILEVSRQSGMAEVATSVIHNIGNVLNSVNVSVSVIAKQVKAMRISGLTKAAQLLTEHARAPKEPVPSGETSDLGKLAAYVTAVTQKLTTQQESLLSEIECLTQHLEHIGRIVAMQQGYARVAGISEVVEARDLIDDALRLQTPAIDKAELQVIRDIASIPPVSTDKHLVLQILVNLISNARHALREKGAAGRLVIRAKRAADSPEGTVCIQVEDNGVGIPPQDLHRIFSHGFTTKPDGHGFGLHGSALAASTIGATLTVKSGGPGAGSTFTLEVPIKPPNKAAQLRETV